jgi:hypothetical protein
MHETAKNLVSVPTVVDHTLVCGERKLRSAFIQWFGQCDGPNELPNEQFFFDTCVKPDDPMWQGKMETFRVIFLGPIKRWPSPEHIRALMQMAKGDEDTNIVWMLSPLPMVVDPGKPTSPSMPIVLLGDPNYGAIKPRFYCDMSVRDRVMAEFEANLPLAEKLLRDPGMELPPEEIPWEDNPRSCSDCERFGHSDSAPRTDDLAYICPYCHRRWWQFNDYYHLWKHVTSREEWDEIRRQQILKDAGYGFPDQ